MSTGNTIAEKILSRKSGTDARAGQIVLAEPDFLFAHDGNRPLAIEAFAELGGRTVKHPERMALVIDHASPPPTAAAAGLHIAMRAFARAQGIRLYDVGSGVCHLVVTEHGHITPGTLVIGSDSHTCTEGALNCLAAGYGVSDIAAAMISGQQWFRVPQTIRIEVTGRLRPGVFAKDAILSLVGQLGPDGAVYMVLEFGGEGLASLGMEERFTLANLAIETGAKAGIVEADSVTAAWLQGRTTALWTAVASDPDAAFARRIVLNLDAVEPMISCPDSPTNVTPISAVTGTPVHEAVIGTCTNGRLSDLQEAARILAGKRVAPGTRLLVVPGSREVLEAAAKDGTLSALLAAGATFVPPGCGPCAGVHAGVPGPGETVVTTANRNFKGRMGNPQAAIYLASPAVVAASAVTGVLTDPRTLLE